MSSSPRRKFLIWGFGLIILGGLLFTHFYVPRFITEIRNPLAQFIKGKHKIVKPSFEDNGLEGKSIVYNSFDGVELSSYLTYASRDSAKGTIILLHGIRSSKECFITLAKRLSEAGYNSVALDSRAHGDSQGIHCTYGVMEKQDVSQLISVLVEQENLPHNIGVWGQSLGGAIALQAMANDDRIKLGIIESTFSDYKTIVNEYFDYHAGFNFEPLTNYFANRAGVIAGFDPTDAQPRLHCNEITQPILIVHGTEDARINIKYGKENFENIPSDKKEFLEMENANHVNVWKVGGEPYFESAIKFLNSNSES